LFNQLGEARSFHGVTVADTSMAAMARRKWGAIECMYAQSCIRGMGLQQKISTWLFGEQEPKRRFLECKLRE
jgi:hypothetical protein